MLTVSVLFKSPNMKFELILVLAFCWCQQSQSASLKESVNTTLESKIPINEHLAGDDSIELVNKKVMNLKNITVSNGSEEIEIEIDTARSIRELRHILSGKLNGTEKLNFIKDEDTSDEQWRVLRHSVNLKSVKPFVNDSMPVHPDIIVAPSNEETTPIESEIKKSKDGHERIQFVNIKKKGSSIFGTRTSEFQDRLLKLKISKSLKDDTFNPIMLTNIVSTTSEAPLPCVMNNMVLFENATNVNFGVETVGDIPCKVEIVVSGQTIAEGFLLHGRGDFFLDSTSKEFLWILMKGQNNRVAQIDENTAKSDFNIITIRARKLDPWTPILGRLHRDEPNDELYNPSAIDGSNLPGPEFPVYGDLIGEISFCYGVFTNREAAEKMAYA